MNGKFAYVLSSSESDYFSEMTAVSLASLRLTNPNANAVLLIDSKSRNSERPIISRLVDDFDEIVEIDIEDKSPYYFSRYMKVKSRDFISGDFLYIDGDTIILKNLEDIWNSENDLCGALDLSSKNFSVNIPQDQIDSFRALGWAKNKGPYINCGVLYMKDNAEVRKFCDEWFRNWIDFGNIVKKYYDQPSFNYSLDRSDLNFHLLSQDWNAQVGWTPLDARDARIAHVFSGQFETRQDTVLHLASRKLRDEGVMDIDLLKEAIANGHVWTSLDTIKKNWAMRRYTAAAGLAVKRVGRELKSKISMAS